MSWRDLNRIRDEAREIADAMETTVGNCADNAPTMDLEDHEVELIRRSLYDARHVISTAQDRWKSNRR